MRREQAERERDELRARLEALQASETPHDTPEGARSPHPDTVGAQESVQEPGAVGVNEEDAARRPWWRRWFGFE